MPIKFVCCVAFLALAASAQTSTPAGAELDLCDFTLRHADEFDDLSVSGWELNGKRWTAHTPWRGDYGDALFTDPGPDGPFSIKDGKLQIAASKDRDGKWRAGMLAAADASGDGWGIQYGYFEARMKMPQGPGTWPAFWLVPLKPTSDPTPSVELDVVEYYGHADDLLFSVWHVWFKPPNEHLKRDRSHITHVQPGSLVDEFHDYGVLIEPDWITFYFDRKPIFRDSKPPELNTPMYPLVSMALGSGHPIDKTPDPTVLEVDYVRIYAPAGPEDDTGC